MNTQDRLRQEIEETHLAFHRLLDSVPDEAFSLPSDNPAWTVGQVFYHFWRPYQFLWLLFFLDKDK
jgi:hypothetical protein